MCRLGAKKVSLSWESDTFFSMFLVCTSGSVFAVCQRAEAAASSSVTVCIPRHAVGVQPSLTLKMR